MSELPQDVWTPVPLRWRYVVPGDTFVGTESRLWQVLQILPRSDGLGVSVISGHQSFQDEVDPDDTVNILAPVTERDAVELCREELGAHLIAQRTT